MGRVGSILISAIVLHLLKDTAAQVMVNRQQWGSDFSRGGSYISGAVDKVFIHHTAGSTCDTRSACSAIVRGIQSYHVNTNEWDDIGYSFLIGQDGWVYEGRGWHRTGAHTYGYNTMSYGIAFIGNFDQAAPNTASLNAVSDLLDSAGGSLTSNYKILGHKDVRNTACPGILLYNIITGWPHYGP